MSPNFDLLKEDMKSWGKTALLFLAPVAILYITFVLTNCEDGFTWSDFIPSIFVQGAIVVYFLNEFLALIKKFVESNKY